MNKKPLDIAGFIKLVIDALNAAKVDYLIGGAIAEWAWGEPRATQDIDWVVRIPIKAINKLSKELEKRDMLLPADVILDSILEDRADIPINVIHMYSGLKADLYPVREGDELRRSAFQRQWRKCICLTGHAWAYHSGYGEALPANCADRSGSRTAARKSG